ncbi:MAG: type II toxin-antitoxin system VapC family toxin [Chloroflexota bacterium]
MIYMLDTHYILWSLFEPEKIPQNIRAILENEADTKKISAVSLWEISLKYSLGKLELNGTEPEEIYRTLLDAGFEMVELDNELLITYYHLPKKEKHRDPFDRLLIWQAMKRGYTVITADKSFLSYENLKVLF